ncbi:MAG: hypothetical protein N4A65_11920 [Cohaesibacter sp.]|jgi:hypothetical protein|nr:hypothetical protein [Cohaesibacter sp.]
MSEQLLPTKKDHQETDPQESPVNHQGIDSQTGYDQRAENAKAIRFMLIKAGIFILIPVIASVLAILFLL